MAHELTIRRNGTAEMAYAGEGAWHGLGQQLQRGASIEQWAAAAGMDWRIQRAMVRYATERGQVSDFLEVPDQHVLFRSDTKASLGLVSSKFKVVQPRDVLEFFRDLVAGNGFELETAGTLFGGRKFWALAHIGERAVIGSAADMVGGYLLLATACDGSMSTEGRFTTTRVVCNNTLSMALNERGKQVVKISHRSEFKPEAMKDRLGIARGQFQRFVTTMRELSKVNVAPVTADVLTSHLFEPALVSGDLSREQRDDAQEKVRDSRGYRQVMDLFVNKKAIGSQLAGADGTAWGWINAVTQYVDHGETGARNYDNQLNAAWFGKGDETKTRAVELALSMA